MLRNKLLNDGVVHLPIHIFEGSYDKRHSAPNNADDVSTAGSLLVKTYVTWVNRGAALAGTTHVFNGGYELEANNTGGIFSFARFCPLISTLRISVSGQEYPSADGLNNASATELKKYTEEMEKSKMQVSLDQYKSYKFYTVFDYTGHQNLFIVPSISVDVGEKVNSRFI